MFLLQSIQLPVCVFQAGEHPSQQPALPGGAGRARETRAQGRENQSQAERERTEKAGEGEEERGETGGQRGEEEKQTGGESQQRGISEREVKVDDVGTM